MLSAQKVLTNTGIFGMIALLEIRRSVIAYDSANAYKTAGKTRAISSAGRAPDF